MSVTLGAALSGVLGLLTGWIAESLRQRSRRAFSTLGAPERSPWLGALGGALFAVLAYGAFVALGLVISVFSFSGKSPDPLPALLGVVLGCACFLLIAWLESLIGPRFGLPAPRDGRRTRSFEDLLDARPRGGPATRWLCGVGLALLPVSYGIHCLVTRKAQFGTRFWPTTVDGLGAIALGLGWIGVGAFLHFHFFFGLDGRLERHSREGKKVALVAACAGLMVAGLWSVATRLP